MNRDRNNHSRNTKKLPKEDYLREDRLQRKEFLQKLGIYTGAGIGLFSGGRLLSPLFARESEDIKLPSPVKSVIFLNMAGGMSHVDTLDPKPGNKFRSIRASNGAYVSEIMPRLARQLKHLNLVRSLHSQEGSHDRGAYLIHTGHRMNAAFQDIPSFGAIIARAHDRHRPKSASYFPAHITLGRKGGMIGKGGFLGVKYDSFHIGNLDRPLSNLRTHWFLEDTDYMRGELLELMNANFQSRVKSNEATAWEEMQKAAIEFMNSEKLALFDLKKEPEKNRRRYGKTKFSKSMLMLKRLAEAEVPFIELTIGGWDTHNNNFAKVRELWKEIDTPLAALIEELAGSGLLKQTLFVLNSEFGRTPEVRADRDGRDHYPRAWSALIGGGNLPRGRVYGATDKKGEKPVKNPTQISEFVATIYKAAGVDYRKSLYTKLGRPYTIIDGASAISGF